MGSVTGKALLENGKRICGFIDKRAKDIRQCIGYPVYDIETLKKKAGRHAVIFVAVKNVFYHMDIAVELYWHTQMALRELYISHAMPFMERCQGKNSY